MMMVMCFVLVSMCVALCLKDHWSHGEDPVTPGGSRSAPQHFGVDFSAKYKVEYPLL